MDRIIDANLNRLREGLRVLEEYFRFASGDKTTADRLYRLRHAVGETGSTAVAARDASRDPGKHRNSGSRDSLTQLLSANFRRCQEACRVLEEYDRILVNGRSRRWQSIRFKLYEMESGSRPALLADKGLYLIITPKYCRESPESIALAACRAGIEIIQYRDPHRTDREIVRTAHELRKITADHRVTFLINNRPDIALISGADGVHLGQDDTPVEEARRILGFGRIIGLSCHTPEQLKTGQQSSADYLAYGPIFSCVSKEREEIIIGLEGLSSVSETAQPLFLVGGLNQRNYAPLLKKGYKRLVFMTALTMSKTMAADIRRIKRIVGANKYSPLHAISPSKSSTRRHHALES
ncbi:MAG: thiamine phosphate synthase [Candidatus Wallbacteria bacterium]|nr:thiamine phosphate synthase [Candidatus Wallbacteria bacterium]